MKKIIFTISLILAFSQATFSQEIPADVSQMTKEQVLELNYNQLLEMSLEDLMKLAEIVGVSLDELYTLILNSDVTAASKKAESLFEAPLSSSVITYDEIIKSGATSFEEALRLIPGVIVRQKTNGNFDVHLRGNDGVPPGNMLNYTENTMSLVMIDNRVVYNYSNGSTFWETLPIGLADVDRIEVVRGPSSALYGPNAATGVINIVTKKPEGKKPSVNVLAQGGTTGSIFTDLSASAGITDHLKVRVSGNFRSTDRFQEDVYMWIPQSDRRGSYGPIESLNTAMVPNVDNGTTVYEENPDKKFPDPSLGRESYGANAWIYYDLKDDIQFNVSAGMQYSDVLTTPIDNPYYAMSRRTSGSNYVDFHAKVKGLNYQYSYTGGTLELSANKPEFNFDYGVMSNFLEYDIVIKDLTIRPGLSYMNSFYSDEDYVNTENLEGFLNGKKELTDMAASLRLDYHYQGLRLVAAGRIDKYNYPDDIYPTYQFVASYNFNEKHLIRGVVSKSNRSPFMIDIYSNYDWEKTTPREFLPDGGHFFFNGNKELKLANIQMYEIGYRAKPAKFIQIDLEGFYTITTDFDLFSMDTMNTRIVLTDFDPTVTLSNPWTVLVYNKYASFSYKNNPVEAVQMGLSFDIKTVVNEDLYFKVFGTIQKTELNNYSPISTEDVGKNMINEAQLNNRVTFSEIYMPTTPPPPDYSTWYQITDYGSSYVKDSLISAEHVYTPTFYGGIMINYSPGEKLNINASAYTYTQQTLSHAYEEFDIDPKLILNLKVSYKVWKENKVFINARNLTNSTTKEFGFMDDIGGLYLIGINLNF